MAAPRIEFWFDFGSNYSYLAMMRIHALAAPAGVQVILRPFLLGPIFKSLGWETSPFVLQKLKGDYTWRDMERQCAKYGLAWQHPTTFPRRALLPARLAVVAASEPWLPEFCRRIMQANFAQDADIEDIAVVSTILTRLGQIPDLWIAMANSHQAKALLRAQTDEAAQRGIFGAPTFFVNGEMYWGNDRLDDAIASVVAARK